MCRRFVILILAAAGTALATEVVITWNQWPYGVRCIGDSFVWDMSPDRSNVTVPAFNPDDSIWDLVNLGGSSLSRIAKSNIMNRGQAQGTPPSMCTYAERQVFSGQTSWGYEHMDTTGTTQYMWLYGFYAQGTQINYDAPYQQVYQFPMRLGNSWECTWTWNYMGMDEVTETRRNYVVAQGRVRVPADTMNWYPCLVLRTYSTSIDELGVINEVRIIHEFVVPDMGRVGGSVATIQSQNGETSPEFTNAEHVFRMKAYHSVFDNQPPTFSNTTQVRSGYNLGPFVIAAQIADANGVQRESLYFCIGVGAWQAAGRDSSRSGWYFFHIPTLSGSDSVRYYLAACDNSPAHNRGTDPAGAPGNCYRFRARDPAEDHYPPEISGTTQWPDTSYTGPFVVSAMVTDSCSVDSVYVLYRFNAGNELVGVPDSIRGSLFYLTIPSAGINTFIRYRIRAVDGSPNHNSGYDPPSGSYSFNVIDAAGPSITGTTQWPDTNFPGPFPVRSTITDVSGVLRSLVFFKFGSANWDSLPADSTRDSTHFLHLPVVLSPMSVRYYIKAVDNSQRNNVSFDPANAPNGYYEFYCVPGSAVEELEPPTPSLRVAMSSINPAEVRLLLPAATSFTLTLFDATGSRVTVLHAGALPAGMTRLSLPVQLAAGTYFLELRSTESRERASFVITR